MDVKEILAALKGDPELKKSLQVALETERGAANLQQELDDLKAAFGAESEEMAKSLSLAEKTAESAEARAKLAEKAIGDMMLHQGMMVNAMRSIGAAVQLQADNAAENRDMIKALGDMVKALSSKPVPSRAVTPVEHPEATQGGVPTQEPQAQSLSDVLDVADCLSKSLKLDRAQGNQKDPVHWRKLSSLRTNLPGFNAYWETVKSTAVKEGVVL